MGFFSIFSFIFLPTVAGNNFSDCFDASYGNPDAHVMPCVLARKFYAFQNNAKMLFYDFRYCNSDFFGNCQLKILLDTVRVTFPK